MNEKDMALMNELLREMEVGRGRRVLLSVKYNMINKINLILLKALICEQGRRGLFVTVDRPHKYMEYLLDINKVQRDRLQFLDIISRFSGESQAAGGSAAEGGTPFGVGDLLHIMESGGGGRDPRVSSIDFGLLDFVMIDNLSAMLSYNELGDVASFIQSYLRLVERYGTIFTAIVMDVRAQPELYRVIQGLCQRELLVSDCGAIQPLPALELKRAHEPESDGVAESVIVYSPSVKKGIAGGAFPSPSGGA
jgi:hypothetical protein